MFRYPEKPTLSLGALWEEAALFAAKESTYDEPSLFGVTDGKAVGTYLEHKFTNFLLEKYEFNQGNSASGIDFPELEIDMKVTSVKQPQSSCPYKSARQKIFGLGYHLIVLSMRNLMTQRRGLGVLICATRFLFIGIERRITK